MRHQRGPKSIDSSGMLEYLAVAISKAEFSRACYFAYSLDPAAQLITSISRKENISHERHRIRDNQTQIRGSKTSHRTLQVCVSRIDDCVDCNHRYGVERIHVFGFRICPAAVLVPRQTIHARDAEAEIGKCF